MHPEKQLTARLGSRAHTRIGALVGLLLASAAFAGEAHAQELTHRFINPSFGGNPFYSDHLLSIANIHRPREPEEPAAEPPTEEELIASQVRARLLSGLSSDILTRIESAQPGESGDFEFGDQRISFTRTRTETLVTFVNSRTGETRRVVIPVNNQTAPSFGSLGVGTSPLAAGSARASSAEQALGALGALPGSSLTSGLLKPGPLEVPLGR